MLLRADLHRLYDAGLLRVSSVGVAEVIALIAEAYGIYDIAIKLPYLVLGSDPAS